MSLYSFICKIHEECFLRNSSSVHWTSSFFLSILLESSDCCLAIRETSLHPFLIGVRHAIAHIAHRGFLVCLRNKLGSWIMIGSAKTSALEPRWGTAIKTEKKKIWFYPEWRLNNSWKLQPPAYNLFTKNLFEENYLGEFCVALMFVKVTL